MNKLHTAKYFYSYKMKSPRHIERVGTILTGIIQVHKKFSDEEVFKLAKETYHGTVEDAILIEIRLIRSI